MIERHSGLELLRIIAMAMVVLVHLDGAALGLPDLRGDVYDISDRDIWKLGVEAITIIGVNCFTMISGYFGIRLKLKSVISFLFQCLFYSLLCFGVYCIFVPSHFSWNSFVDNLLILSTTDLWYVPAYFILMLLSPFLNAGCEKLDKRRFLLTLSALLFFSVWCGWWHDNKINPNGYTIFQLVTVYLIARYIRIYHDEIPANKDRLITFEIYFISLIAIFVSSLFLSPIKGFAYNSPFVLLSSVAFFMIFRNMSFRSTIINQAARSVFAVYLIHKSPEVWVHVLLPVCKSIWSSLSIGQYTGMTLLITLILFMISFIIDPIRRVISNKILTLL